MKCGVGYALSSDMQQICGVRVPRIPSVSSCEIDIAAQSVAMPTLKTASLPSRDISRAML